MQVSIYTHPVLLLFREDDVSSSQNEEVSHEITFHDACRQCRELLEVQVKKLLKRSVISHCPLRTEYGLPDWTLRNDTFSLAEVASFNRKS